MSEPAPSDLWLFRQTAWPGTAAGVTQRGPHALTDPASGHNLGHTAGADPVQVRALRHRALAELGLTGQQIVCSDQVHGTEIAVARREDVPDLPRRHGWPYYPQADAVLTAERGLVLLLFFADCCPVFLFGAEPLCGGIAHCGWRGSVADLAGKTVAAMQTVFGAVAGQLESVVGPCICVRCYEIGPEVAEAVQATGLSETLHEHGSRLHLDLLALNRALLMRAGLPAQNIRLLTTCTRCGNIPLHSYRRDGKASGRIAAFFALR